MADDPFAQQQFSELLKRAIEEAEALFEHPLKQYALFKAFEDKVNQREVEGIPSALADNPHARAYFGVLRLVLDSVRSAIGSGADEAVLVDEALAIDRIVERAVAEHSLNQQDMEAAIRKGLLPRLFKVLGMEKAKEAIDAILGVVRVGMTRRVRT